MAGRVTTTIFRSNKTQAVHLPKAVAFPGVAFPGEVSEVEIIAIGSSRLICPVGIDGTRSSAVKPGCRTTSSRNGIREQ